MQSASGPNSHASNNSSIITSPDKNIGRLKSLSSSETDPDESIAQAALLEFSGLLSDESGVSQSSPTRHHFRSGSVSHPDSLGAASFVSGSATHRDASTNAVKSTPNSISTIGGFATPLESTFKDARKGSAASGNSESSPDGYPAAEAVATPVGQDSPTLGHFPLRMTSRVEKNFARNSLLLNRNKSQRDNSIENSRSGTHPLDHGHDEVNGERVPHFPFMPRFLKVVGSPRESMVIDDGRAAKALNVGDLERSNTPRSPTELDTSDMISAFESRPSEREVARQSRQAEEEQVFIGGAKLASLHKARVVSRGNSSSSRLVNMKDVLNEGITEAAAGPQKDIDAHVHMDSNTGPSKSKVTKILGQKVINLKRGSLLNMPAVNENTEKATGLLDGSQNDGKARLNWQRGLMDGLRSNPVVRTASVPGRKKRVSLPLELIEAENRVRESVVSTPYPLGHRTGSGDEGTEVEQSMEKARDGGKVQGTVETIFTMVIYSHNGSTPLVNRVAIPETKEKPIFDEDGKKPPFRATIKTDFDDEKLFKLMKKEYLRMRGVLKYFASARTVHGISLLGFHRLSQLASKEHRGVRRKTFRVYEDAFTEARMLALWQDPTIGRGKHEWIAWVKRLPRYSEGLHTNEDHIALEIVEGWSFYRILGAISLSIILSLLATLLWTFLGVSGGVLLQNDGMVGSPVDLKLMDAGFRGAGARLEGGVLLGLLVLFLGWTCVGAWILLSWLVM